MELRVNDYVRTNDGCICKVLQYTEISDTDFYVNTDSPYNVIYKSWIIKSSPNIIDLIEVGDYVNGGQVREIKKDYIRISGGEYNWQFLEKEEIKSIVTKEQFSQMEYRIGE